MHKPKRPARKSAFASFLSSIRSTGIFDPAIPNSTLNKWWNDSGKQEKIVAAHRAFWLSRERKKQHSTSDDRKNVAPPTLDPLHKELLSGNVNWKFWQARWKRIAELPPLPKDFDKGSLPQPSDTSPDTLAFNAKILPSIETDAETGSFYTEATLAAMNLPGWADTIARYARAAIHDKHRPKVKKFFIELGKALASGRTLWDHTDELIFCNYYSTDKFKKPLSQMTEQEGSICLNMSVGAYDKRLQRLGIKRKGGRPRKQDKSS